MTVARAAFQGTDGRCFILADRRRDRDRLGDAAREDLPAAARRTPDDRAGQFYVVRLTAPDGYHAQRDYSVASVPGGDEIELTVEALPDGEASEFLHNVVEVGDVLQVRGPIGRFFSWDGAAPIWVSPGFGRGCAHVHAAACTTHEPH